MPLDLEKLARIDDQWLMLNEQAVSLGERYRDRLKDAEEARRAAVYRTPEFATHSLARLNQVNLASLAEAGVITADLQAANRHAAAAQRLKGQLDRLHTDMAPMNSQRLRRSSSVAICGCSLQGIR